MSDTTDLKSGVTDSTVDSTAEATSTTGRRRRGTGLSAMLLPQLQALASSLGISGIGRMRKSELIAAIEQKQGVTEPTASGQPGAKSAEPASTAGQGAVSTPESPAPPAQQPADSSSGQPEGGQVEQQALPGADAEVTRAPRRATRPAGPPTPRTEQTAPEANDAADKGVDKDTGKDAPKDTGKDTAATGAGAGAEAAAAASDATDSDTVAKAEAAPAATTAAPADTTSTTDTAETATSESGDTAGGEKEEAAEGQSRRGERGRRGDRSERGERNERADRGERAEAEDQSEGGGRRRRGRFRDRRRGRERTSDGEPVVAEDDVLVPVAGIVDVLENYAFIRTSGYLSGPNDVYVSMSQVRKYGLRRGDAVTGAVRAPREGEQRRDKYNPLVRLDTINGMDPEEAKRRPEFYKLTPLYPQERLRLETEPHILTTRVIDLLMPIGKGQRALIVSPPKAGKTTVLQNIANGITTNNPECHLMVVLVDERPEEVTDMQRSVKGEVIAATFDRPPSDHTTLAELAIERAKRLVELGVDVVVLLDSITRMGRSYNLAAPASGRIMSGGIDSTALYPPKRFLGAARNIENGGSLTIIGTALVETGSTMDTVIFEEFKATGNAELKLDRKIADRRVFPAVDVNASSTRKEELLLGREELAIVHKLRRVLAGLDSQQALDLLLERLKKTKTNAEFLMQIAKSTPGE